MSSLNFDDILNQKTEDIPDPVLLPAGIAALTIQSYETGESSRKHTPYVQFNVLVDDYIEPDDPEALEEFGSPTGKKINIKYYLSENALFMLRDALLTHIGVTEGSTVSEMLEEAKGMSCAGRIDHELSEDGERTFARLNKLLVLE